MNCHAESPAFDIRFLDWEWARIAMMLALAEATRTGADLDGDFAERFAAAGAAVAENRAQGVWSGLAGTVDPALLGVFLQLDLDILALALAPDARPVLGPRLHSLQPNAGGPWPTLALIQELLMLENGAEVLALFDRLDATAPLVASGLVRVTGEGPAQMVRATRLAQRAVLTRTSEVTAPPGATL